MNLPRHINSKYISISFIKGNLLAIYDELGGIISNTLNKNWKSNQYPLTEIVNINSFVSASHFEVIQCLMWQPKAIDSDLVVFINNMPDGWPTLLNYYLKHYDNREIINVRLSDKSIEYSVNEFVFINKSIRRIVHSIKDFDKWIFYQEGPLLSFENEMNYKRKKISDRLNDVIVQEYLKENNINISKPDFWISKGMAIEFSTKLKGR